MWFDPIRGKNNHLEGIVVGAQVVKDQGLLENLMLRIKNKKQLGEIQGGKFIMFFYKHEDCDVEEEDIPIAVPTRQMSPTEVELLLSKNLVATKINRYGTRDYKLGALKISVKKPEVGPQK